MAVNNFDNLKAALADWLGRGDLTGQIPDFIALAEAEIARRVKRRVVRAALTVSGEQTNLPATLDELRSIRIDSGTPANDLPIPVVTPEAQDEWRKVFIANGKPRCAAVIGNELVVVPIPDATYTTEIVYFQKYVPLSDAATTNIELVESPDLLLYGALCQAEPYIGSDARIPVWKAKFDAAIEQENLRRERKEFSAGMRQTKPPVQIG